MFPPSPGQNNWAIDVLTTDYLLSGTIDGDHNHLAFQTSGDFQSLILTGARATATGNLSLPDSPPAPWMVVYSDQVVAVIPRDSASLAYARQRTSDWKIPQPVEICVGPYWVRGTLLSPAGDARTLAAFSAGFVVQPASISSLLPGARLSALSAPYAVFMGRHKHWLRPAP